MSRGKAASRLPPQVNHSTQNPKWDFFKDKHKAKPVIRVRPIISVTIIRDIIYPKVCRYIDMQLFLPTLQGHSLALWENSCASCQGTKTRWVHVSCKCNSRESQPQPLVSSVYHKYRERDNKTSSGIERFNANSKKTLQNHVQNDANAGNSCRYM